MTSRARHSCSVIRDKAWRAAGFTPRYIARAADTHAAITFVGAGVGITVLPRLAIGTPPPTVAVLDIDDPKPGAASSCISAKAARPTPPSPARRTLYARCRPPGNPQSIPFTSITDRYQPAESFGRPGQCRIVDVDYAESFRVTPGPFEVVHQRPDEVPADVDAGRDRIAHGPQVAVEIGDSVDVVDDSVGADGIGECGSVLGDRPAADPGYSRATRTSNSVNEPGSIGQPMSVCGPPCGMAYARWLPGQIDGSSAPLRIIHPALGQPQLVAGLHRRNPRRRVVVDPQPVGYLVDRRQVTVAHERPVGQVGRVGQQVGRVAPAQDRIEEDPVGDRIDRADRVDVLGRIRGAAGRWPGSAIPTPASRCNVARTADAAAVRGRD